MTTHTPGLFIMRHPDVPFNFDYGWQDFDQLYHDPTVPAMLKGGGGPEADPCTWTDELKAEVNTQRDAWVAQYEAWCKQMDAAQP